jgi:hypothetical protein
MLYLGPSTVIFRYIIDPHVLETLACREAQALASDLHAQRLFVASECLPVVRDIDEKLVTLIGTWCNSYGSLDINRALVLKPIIWLDTIYFLM